MMYDTKGLVIVFAKRNIGDMFMSEKGIKSGSLAFRTWDDVVKEAKGKGFSSAVVYTDDGSKPYHYTVPLKEMVFENREKIAVESK